MKHFNGALRAALSLMVVAMFAAPVQARITIDALGGELEVEGFLKSETRARIGAGDAYLGQWLQRLQVEAALKYTDVGVFDELTFVAIARPEYDIIQDTGNFSSSRIGDGSDEPSLSGRLPFTAQNERLAFGGFDANFGPATPLTGGISHLVSHGLETQSWLNESFEVDFTRGNAIDARAIFLPGGGVQLPGGAFPQVVQKASNLELDCARCVDLNIDNTDVATGRTDSNGRLYPFRELYVDGVIGDWWIRLGKQQIVWGKTDFFRLQDVINPVDFGQHFFFDSFEDIRIPQWMASIQWKAGSFGPLTDNAVQLVWNFDEFQQVGLGNPSSFWAHPFSKDFSTFAIFNTYFSPEPCVGPVAFAAQQAAAPGRLQPGDACGSFGVNDNRTPSGFGNAAGLTRSDRPGWDIENTEVGLRWEFRLSDFRFAVSHWYGWNDIPVFRFDQVHLGMTGTDGSAAALAALNNVTTGDVGLARDALTGAGAAQTGRLDVDTLNATKAGLFPGGLVGFSVPTITGTPQQVAQIAQRVGNAGVSQAATTALATGNYAPLWTGTDPGYTAAFGAGACNGVNVQVNPFTCTPFLGGAGSLQHKQSHTLGLAMDYFESWSGVVMRIESSWTFDELVTNTRTVNWVDDSDVMRFSLGFDRPTFIPFLNKDRTFFLSLQIFDTWYWDHEGDKNTGYLTDEHNWITTFFFIGNYMRDTLKPVGFYVWEEFSNSHVAGLNLEWLIDNHWSVKGGFHLIWEGDENRTNDTGVFTSYVTNGPGGTASPYVSSALGPGRQGIGALRNYDEVFFELKYQF